MLRLAASAGDTRVPPEASRRKSALDNRGTFEEIGRARGHMATGSEHAMKTATTATCRRIRLRSARFAAEPNRPVAAAFTGARTRLAITGMLLGLAMASGCVNHSGSEDRPDLPATWEFDRLDPQVYTPRGWPEPMEAFVYRPRRQEAMPAVLVVHGGGWTRRSPTDMNDVAAALAARGFVVVNVAYRLAPDHTYPAAVHDLQQALDWMVSHADELRIDPQRIGGLGYSAGAHLVSLLATLETGPDPQWSPPKRGYRMRAIVAGGTPADLTRWPDSPLVNEFLGKPLDEAPELWREASPITHVTPASPPFFLYHGGLDMLVEVRQAETMQQVLAEVDVPAELYVVPYHGHFSMFLLNRSAVRQGAAFLAQMLN
jgi:acetyl esterase/lipase